MKYKAQVSPTALRPDAAGNTSPKGVGDRVNHPWNRRH